MSSLHHVYPLAGFAILFGLTSCDQVYGLDRGAGCGDGVLAQDEDCDDGESVPGDGCGSTCLIEPGFECPVTNAGQPCLPVVGLARGPVATELPAAGTMGGSSLGFECAPDTVMIGLEGHANPVGDNLGRIRFICGSLALGDNGHALLTEADQSALFGTQQSGPLLASSCASDEVVTGFVPTTNTYVSGMEWICEKLTHEGGELRTSSPRSIAFGPTVGTRETARNCPRNHVLTRASGTIGSSVSSLGFSCSPVSAAVCGDGMVVKPETCDDGNIVRHDGCDGRCLLE